MRNPNSCLMWSAECCCVALFREPIKWLVFNIQTCFHFSCRSVSYYSVSKIYFPRFTSKRKRNTLKGFMKGSLGKKQFVQQQEMPIVASCVQVKFLHGLVSHLQKRFPYSYVLRAVNKFWSRRPIKYSRWPDQRTLKARASRLGGSGFETFGLLPRTWDPGAISPHA